MSNTLPINPLGQVLQQADLISTAQIEVALQDQTQADNMRLGEILALRGWLKQETADFFAKQWPTLPIQKLKQPLGQYLKEAGLLDEHQIRTILSEQRQMGLRFGELVVLKGWLKSTTINFFLEHLDPEHQQHQQILPQGEVPSHDSPVQAKLLNFRLVEQQKNQLKVASRIYQSVFDHSWADQVAHLRPFSRSTIKLFKLDEKASRPDILLEEVLSWTGNHQPFLIQKLCQLLSESEAFIPAGEEAARVQQLVQTCLIDHWETQVASEHLTAIREGLLRNQQCDPVWLLRLYQKILQQGEVPSHESPAQAELLKLKLVEQQENKLKVASRIYQSVFDQSWVNQELLARFRPFSHSTIKLFKLDEKASRPDILLEKVMSWTGDDQSFLTQKLCQLLSKSEVFIPAGEEAARVQQLVQTRLINHWETQVASEPLSAIREGLLRNQQCDPVWLLRLYQQILQQGEVPSHESPAQAELLNLGLVVQQENKLKVANRIYQSVFDQSWVDQELEKRLRHSYSNQTIRVQNKSVSEDAHLNAKTVIFSAGNTNFKRIWVFIISIGLLLVCFNIFKLLEVKIIFKRSNELLNLGKYQQAIATYNQILNIDSNYYQAWTNRGYALAGLQEYNKMLESCSSATIIEPRAVYSWNCQGEALHNLKQYDKAIAAFDQAITLDSKDPIFWINKTESLLALKQADKALAAIDEAIKILKNTKEVDVQETIKKNLSVAFSHKGQALSQKQEYAEAIEAYNQALTYDPNYFTAQQGRGLALQGWGRHDEAIAQFNQILNQSKLTNPQKTETLYYLGLALCHSSNVNAKKGLITLENALKLKPDYQAAQDAKKNCR